MPYAPKYTGDAGIDFTVPIADRLTLIARIDMSATGKTWFSPMQNNSVQTEFGVPGDFSKTERDAYQLVKGRVVFGARSGM